MSVGLGGFQETDQLPIFSKITKYQAHVNNPARMAELTARAFDRAVLEMGPTQLNIPRDYLYGEIECEIPQPLRIERGPGGSASLDAAADLLAKAKFPVIIAGGGVLMANGVDAAIALAETLDAPVCNSYLHNDSFPVSHRLWCGPLGYHGSKAAMKVIAKADVVLALGSRLGPFGVLPQYGFDYWPASAKLVQVDADPRVLGLVKKTGVAVNGDAREAALALVARLKARPLAGAASRDERLAVVRSEKEAWAKELASWDFEKDAWSLEVAKGSKYMHPRQVLRELEKALPADAMVSTDIGNICQIANSYLKFERPRSMFGAMMFGNCGYAFPTMIGCKAGAPERTAIAYVGDGAWGMSFGELLTCVREKIPVTAVVFNNEQWGAEKKNHVDFYSNRFLGVNLENPSFAGIAKAMGAEGARIDKLSDVGPALRDACKAQKDGRTTVVELMCTRELGDPFRRDALKKPTRMLEKYKGYV
jgi:sulfoacetaldehyde acetyltransferase